MLNDDQNHDSKEAISAAGDVRLPADLAAQLKQNVAPTPDGDTAALPSEVKQPRSVPTIGWKI